MSVRIKEPGTYDLTNLDKIERENGYWYKGSFVVIYEDDPKSVIQFDATFREERSIIHGFGREEIYYLPDWKNLYLKGVYELSDGQIFTAVERTS